MSKRGKKEDSVAAALRRTPDQVSTLERKLAETQGLLDHLLLSNPAVLYRSEAKGNHAVTFISPNIKEQLGYEARDFLKDPSFWVDHIHPEDAPKIPAEFTKLLELGHNAHEYRVRAKNGTYRWMRDEMNLVRDAHGEPLETVGHWMDITEQKRIEVVLKESEKNYRTLVDNALVGIFKTNLKGKILYVNDAIVRMLGFETPGELMAYPAPFTYKNPSDRTALVKQLAQSGRVESFETTYLTKTGGSKILLLNATLEGDTLTGMAVDITDRKKTEEALGEEKSYLTVTLQSIGDGVMTADIHGNITTMNIVAEELTGWTQVDSQGRPLAEVFHIVNAFTRERCENPVQKVLQEGKISGLANHTMLIARDGTERIIADTASPIRNTKGDILGVVLIFRDVTELEKAEKIKIEMAQLSSILDGISSLIYIVDPKTCEIIYANKAIRDLFQKPLVGGKCYQELQGVEGPCSFCTNDIILHNNGEPYTWENHNPVVDRDFLMVDRLISWPDGRQVRFESALDITERKQAQEAIQQSEEKYRNLFENTPGGAFRSKMDGSGFLALNKRLAEMLGYSKEELLATPSTIHWADPDGRQELVRVLRENGLVSDYEIRVVTKSGAIITVLASMKIYPKEGYIEGMLADITARKLAEEHLKQSEEKYRNLFENTPVGIFRSKFDGSAILAVNNKCAEMFGYSKEEMIANLGTFVWANPKERAEMMRQLREKEILSDFEMQAVIKNGAIRTFLTSMTLYPAEGYIEGMIIDITDRKRTAEALEASEENYRNMIANLSEGIYVVTLLDGTILNHNIEFVKILGFDLKENLIGKQTPDFWFNPEDRKGYLEEFRRHGILRNYPVTAKKRDGTKIFVEVNARLVKDKQNNPTIIEGTIVDITERKRAEEKLQEGEARFRATFEQAAVGIAHTSMEGQFLLINQRFCDIVGYPREKMLKLTFQLITYPQDVEIDLNYHHQLLMGTIPTYSMEKRYVRKNNSIVWVNLTVSLVRETAGEPKYFITVIEDITTRKRAEEVLGVTVKALKRSNNELEQFAYVASHDLQEPLRMISSYVQLIARRYKGKLDADADDFINFAIDGAERMKTLINDLLAFSRVTTRGQPFAPINATEVLTDVLQNLAVAIEDARAVITHEPLPSIIADPGQLGQVFQNLIGNAIKFHGEQPPEIHVGVTQTPEEWIFSVKDNGIGIEPQYFDRLFKIFQRLNPNEQFPGTGIGLAVCKRIMERHGGRIWIESELGKGATFYFSIPIKNEEDIKNE